MGYRYDRRPQVRYSYQRMAAKSIEELAKELEEIYSQMDVELRTYSEKANKNDPTADKHLQREKELQQKAHAITRQMAGLKG